MTDSQQVLGGLRVERMSFGPEAVAHTPEGKVVLLTGGAPGDVVDARVTEDKPTMCRAEVTRVLEPSPARVEPACPFASVCGGCPWAHMGREAQLEAKRAVVVDSLARIGRMPREDAEALVRPALPAGPAWGYRNKVELAFVREGKRFSLGMHARGGTGVVRVDKCPLLDQARPKLVKSVAGAVSYLATSSGIEPTRVAIRTSARTGELEVALWTQPSGFPRGQAAKVIRDACGASSVVRVIAKGPAKSRRVVNVERLHGAGSWAERIDEDTMRFSAPSFFQVNTQGAEVLRAQVMAALAPQEDEVAWDLYSGAGTFTLPLARACDFVEAIESSGPAVRDLRRNLELAHLDNVEPYGGDAAIEQPEEEPDVVVVDPPRAGLDPRVVASLAASGARAIAYVSCDPATLARDLARFAEDGTYAPRYVQPVDQFAQTYHVECVTLLEHA